MQRFAIVVVVCVTGCSDQSTTPTTIPTTPAPQGRNTVSRSDEGTTLSETTVGGIVLQPKTVINGKLSLLIPQEFTIMDDEMLRIKYPSERRPTLIYTNESGTINVAINHTKDRVPQSELAAFHKQMDSMLRNLYPSATWFESGVIGINGRDWLTLDLRTPAIDTKIRNIMVGTSLEGRLLLVTFNVTEELEDTWLASGNAIVQSLRVTD